MSSIQFACHLDYGKEGRLAVVSLSRNGAEARPLEPASPTGRPAPERPTFVGVDWQDGRSVFLLEAGGSLRRVEALPADAVPTYAYVAPDGALWFSHDGDKEEGRDPARCPGGEAAVSVIRDHGGTPRLDGTVCVGRGHHVTAFVPAGGGHPARAFVSNLLDGDLVVLGADPADGATYLKELGRVDLRDPERQGDPFPHGLVHSPATGRVYNLNNGYRTVACIDPESLRLERASPMGVSSNLLLSPCGRFLIGKGADRKSDPEHVLGRVCVMEAESGRVVAEQTLPDLYPSTYRFSPDGRRLYVTSAATGKGTQRERLRKDLLLVYDAARLPELILIQELRVGPADCGRRPLAFPREDGRVLVPDSEGGLSILDGLTGRLLQHLTLGPPGVREPAFSYWGGAITGA